jgi:hypothetical protein
MARQVGEISRDTTAFKPLSASFNQIMAFGGILNQELINM